MGNNPLPPPSRSDELRGVGAEFGIVTVPSDRLPPLIPRIAAAFALWIVATFVLLLLVGPVAALASWLLFGALLADHYLRRRRPRPPASASRIRALERANDRLDVELAKLGVPRDGIRLALDEPTVEQAVADQLARDLRSNERGYVVLPGGHKWQPLGYPGPPEPPRPAEPTYRSY